MMDVGLIQITNSLLIPHKFIHTIGIDEVGRGPIAGPVAVGSFVILDKKALRLFSKVKESKQLKEKDREEWF
jgi:ribonuclease HII